MKPSALTDIRASMAYGLGFGYALDAVNHSFLRGRVPSEGIDSAAMSYAANRGADAQRESLVMSLYHSFDAFPCFAPCEV